jgi:hypothetical protein
LRGKYLPKNKKACGDFKPKSEPKKCRHRKRIILASASMVEFIPDQEPFTEGVIESCGIEYIKAENLNIHYCPRCKQIQDIEIDGEIFEEPY